MQRIAHVALIVDEYDTAIAYFTGRLGFELLQDTDLGNGKRWVLVAPRGEGTALLLARASNADQTASLGKQGAGRVLFFLHTDEFWQDYRAMRERGVRFIEEPRSEVYGTVVVFEDLYGNRWDLVERRAAAG